MAPIRSPVSSVSSVRAFSVGVRSGSKVRRALSESMGLRLYLWVRILIGMNIPLAL